jgi:predicted dithiol-disulfide oxidoreductase (DUF899 family)
MSTTHQVAPRDEWLVVREGNAISHAQSSYARSVAPFFGVDQWLDRTPKGRTATGPWFRGHDEHDNR